VLQGNFFQNIGSITLFSVFGTAISAFIVGGGIYFLGQVRITALKSLSLSGLLFESPFFKSRQTVKVNSWVKVQFSAITEAMLYNPFHRYSMLHVKSN